MAIINWGMLAKSQVDPETIEQAIARLLAGHGADETAHLGVGESLQSHKASQIIDHLASSIIEDKIADFSVTTNKLLDTRIIFRSLFESLDAWAQFKTGGRGSIALVSLADVALTCGNQANDYVALLLQSSFFNINFTSSYPIIEVFAYIGEPTSQDFIIFVGNDWARSTSDGLGFIYKASESKFYAWWKKTGTLYEQEITGISTSVEHRYRAVKDSTSIKFYVDGVLKYTATTNLPTAGAEFSVGAAFKAIDTSSPQGQLISFLYIQD